MKGFLKNITDTLADAALLEMGVGAYASSNEPLVSSLKKFFGNFSVTMADAALLEIGVWPEQAGQTRAALREAIEEHLVEAAFAEAADYDQIHDALLKEHQDERDIAHPDDCQYGDNDLCFV